MPESMSAILMVPRRVAWRRIPFAHRGYDTLESAVKLIIDLADTQAQALAVKARAQGLSAEEYARQVLDQDLAPEWLRQAWDRASQTGVDQLSPEEIDAEIAAARKARRESRSQPGS
jgi:plasmid stability protein